MHLEKHRLNDISIAGLWLGSRGRWSSRVNEIRCPDLSLPRATRRRLRVGGRTLSGSFTSFMCVRLPVLWDVRELSSPLSDRTRDRYQHRGFRYPHDGCRYPSKRVDRTGRHFQQKQLGRYHCHPSTAEFSPLPRLELG